MFLAWALLGALLGVAASKKKGFSLAGGIVGGLLLGPLAFLMFFVNGARSGRRVRQPTAGRGVLIFARRGGGLPSPMTPSPPRHEPRPELTRTLALVVLTLVCILYSQLGLIVWRMI